MSDAFDHEETPPAHELAEAALLGAALWKPDAARGLVAQLAPDDFDREGHRVIAQMIATMVTADEHIDTVTLTERLARSGQLEEAGEAGGIADLHAYVPKPHAWPSYLEIVKREGHRRRTLRALRRAIARLESGEDPDVVLAELAPATTPMEVAA